MSPGLGHSVAPIKGTSGFPHCLENLEFCHFLFQCWKISGICSKSGKNLEFYLKTWKKLEIGKFYVSSFTFQDVIFKNNSVFQASLFKMSFSKIILIYFFVISTLSTQTLIRSQIDLGFYCFYLEITWKIHGILCDKRSGNPVHTQGRCTTQCTTDKWKCQATLTNVHVYYICDTHVIHL